MSPSAAPSLTWRDGGLLRDGRPHRILSGAVHYFRIHPGQWEDRLRRLAAMGANTVDTYVAWNFHERVEGRPDFTGWRDVERFIRIAGAVGLDVFLRPSPYICAEWSNGGIPFWLSGRTRALRTSDPVFLAAVDAWYDVLIPRLAPLQAAHGGPIRLVQVENEYGSFGSDGAYLAHLRDGTGVPKAVELRRDGEALMCSELWGGWFDHWGEKHHVRSAASMIGTVQELLDAGGSVSLYMAHGGTNFGLWNGANHDGVLQPTVTSYDSDAPIGEDGTLNDKFHALRAAFAPFHDGDLPPIPDAPRRRRAASAPLRPVASLPEILRALPVRAVAPVPLSFEELGAEDGLVAYEADVSYPADAVLGVLGLRDRATVLLDGVRLGTLEHDGSHELRMPEAGGSGRLTILVESLGRDQLRAADRGAQGHPAGRRDRTAVRARLDARVLTGRADAEPVEAPADPSTGSGSALGGSGSALGGFRVRAGGLRVRAGGLRVRAGGLRVRAGGLRVRGGLLRHRRAARRVARLPRRREGHGLAERLPARSLLGARAAGDAVPSRPAVAGGPQRPRRARHRPARSRGRDP
nr:MULTISPECIES: beta-galactosidase [Microbacterium]